MSDTEHVGIVLEKDKTVCGLFWARVHFRAAMCAWAFLSERLFSVTNTVFSAGVHIVHDIHVIQYDATPHVLTIQCSGKPNKQTQHSGKPNEKARITELGGESIFLFPDICVRRDVSFPINGPLRTWLHTFDSQQYTTTTFIVTSLEPVPPRPRNVRQSTARPLLVREMHSLAKANH